MHQHKLGNWQHSHDFVPTNHHGEKRTLWVLLLTLLTMILEIGAGTRFHSMALLADGWHMATHVVAFMITIFAYRYSRIHHRDQTFAFSSAKVGVLGGFASSIALAMVALMMIGQSTERLLMPQVIQFDEAVIVAAVGLIVNIFSALLLGGHHHHHAHNDDHDHDHDHDHASDHHHQDHNLRAAYLHVMADALTSVLAIIALVVAKYYGWTSLDPVMGYVGALVILVWAWGLIKETSPVLLDQSAKMPTILAVKRCLQQDGDTKVVDLHIWRLTASHYAAIVVLVSQTPRPPHYYKALLAHFHQLEHLTIEVNQCDGLACRPITESVLES